MAKKEKNKISRFTLELGTLQSYIDRQTKIIYPKPERITQKLYPSSFPFCGLQRAWFIINDEKQKPFDYFGDYYTGVGNVAHEIMQNQLGKGKKILGDWKCKDCGHTKKLAYYARCKKCSSENVEYEELAIKFGKYTSGKIDGVVELDGKLYVVDYKSSSVKKNAQHREKKNVYPYMKNVEQIKSYVTYLEDNYDIKINGWILIYVSRDSSFRDYVCVGDYVSDDEKEILRKKHKHWDKAFGVAEKFKNKDLTAEKKIKYINWLVKHKPCESMAEYKKKMWGGYEIDCTLARTGICFNSEKLKLEIDKKLLGKKVNAIL